MSWAILRLQTAAIKHRTNWNFMLASVRSCFAVVQTADCCGAFVRKVFPVFRDVGGAINNAGGGES